MRLRPRLARRLLAALAVACVASLAPPALAEPAARPDAARVNARAKGEEGLALFGAEKFGEAYERFRQADELFHAPTLVLYMARCRRNTGKLVAAARHYEQVLAEPDRAEAAAAFVEAKAQAKRELDAVRARIPKLTVRVTGGAASEATLDGEVVKLAELRGRAVDPGPHTIAITTGDGRTVQRDVQAPEGSSPAFVIDLGGARSTPEPSLAPASPSPAEPASPEPAHGGSFVPAGIAFGVGAVALGVGIATGAASMAKVSDIQQRCDGTQCLKSDAGNADAARGLATASTVSFVLAGVGVATGGVLLLVRRRAGTTPEPPRVEAAIGPASLLVRGAF
jgi:hypothetical protein